MKGLSIFSWSCYTEEGSPFHRFFQSAKGRTREEIGHLLEMADDISAAHAASANEGQTETPPLDEQLDLHFVALVHKDGHLYELG